MRKSSSSGTEKIAAGRAPATGSVLSRYEVSQSHGAVAPLIQHKLTILRDKRTSTRDFKRS